jgi:hypothetical protein
VKREPGLKGEDDVVPAHSISDQFKDIADQDARSPERELAVVDLWVGTKESSGGLPLHVGAASVIVMACPLGEVGGVPGIHSMRMAAIWAVH